MNNKKTITVPVSATYRIIDGHPVEVDRVEKEIDVDALARFLIKSFGITAIAGDGESE